MSSLAAMFTDLHIGKIPGDLCVSCGMGEIQSSFMVVLSFFTNRLESVGPAAPHESHTSEDWKAVPLYVKSHTQAAGIRLVPNIWGSCYY